MNRSGFIALHRQLLDWKYKQFPAAVALWVHILLKANWKDGFFLGEPIPRGTLATSIRHLAEDTGLSANTVRKWLRKFESDGQISLKVTQRFTLVKVANYATFQDIFPQGGDTPVDTPTDTLTDTQSDTLTEPNRTKKQSNKETNKRVGRSAPSLREISDFIGEEGLNVDPPKFWKYYSEWGKPFPADWKTRCRRWSETEHVRGQPQQNVVVEGPEWLKHMDVEIDKDKIDF